MAKNDIPAWTVLGVFIGMITTNLVSPTYTVVGALIGGAIGYMLGKMLR